MRPTRQESDLEWSIKNVQFWASRRQFYAELLRGADWNHNHPDWAYFTERDEHCIKQQEVANLLHQEAQGLIVVYTGRPKPSWM